MQRFGGCSAQAHDYPRAQDVDLGVEPRPARTDFCCFGFGVNTSFASRLPLEVFDDVGDVRTRTVDPRLLERFVQDPARGSHERMTREVLVVARLFSDEHHFGGSAFAEHCLRGAPPEMARPATARRGFERPQRASPWERCCDRHLRSACGEQGESEEHQEHEEKDARENLGDRE